jgi:hypothetical protein
MGDIAGDIRIILQYVPTHPPIHPSIHLCIFNLSICIHMYQIQMRYESWSIHTVRMAGMAYGHPIPIQTQWLDA